MRNHKSLCCLLVLLLVLSLLLAACGQEPPPAPAATVEPTAAPTAAPAPDVQPTEEPAPDGQPTAAPAPEVTPEPLPEGSVRVSSAEELLRAIEPGAEVVLAPGVYDLSAYLGGEEKEISPYVSSVWEGDGPGVVIRDVEGLCIRGEAGSRPEIVTEHRYADVLRFENCGDIILQDLVLGHTPEQGECAGAVLSLEGCRDLYFSGLDLYGCGTYGIAGSYTTGLLAEDCLIRDCSYGAVDAMFSSDLRFRSSSFRGCSGFELLNAYASMLYFEDCSFEDNTGSGLFYVNEGGGLSFMGCSFGAQETAHIAGADFAAGTFFDDRCTFSGEAGRTLQVVSTAEELLEAIGPDRTLLLQRGDYLLSDAADAIWTADAEAWNQTHEWVQLRECYDGVEVLIRDVDGLTLLGQSGDRGDVQILTDPRYATVLNFEDCSDLSLLHLTVGHTERGDCEGDVLGFTACRNVRLANTDLFGCGCLGIHASGGAGLFVYDSLIRDCSFGPLDIYDWSGQLYVIHSSLTGSLSGGSIGYSDAGESLFYRCTFGQRESNYFYFAEQVNTEDCRWEEITEYPDYSGDDWEAFVPDMDAVEAIAFDGEVLCSIYWVGCQAVTAEGEQLALPWEDPETDVVIGVSLEAFEDGSGSYWDGFSGERAFTWAQPEDGGAALLGFADGGSAEVRLYTEERDGGSMYWLCLSMDGTEIWCY